MIRGGRPPITALVTFIAGLAVIVTGTVTLAVAHTHRPAANAAPNAETPAPPSTSPARPIGRAPSRPAATKVTATSTDPAAPAGSMAQVAVPVELTIPSIGVSTPLIRLGLTRSGALQVPDRFGIAGWYDRSPRPGATGPAVIAGHIDSVSGPAVFYRLDLLHPGDQVDVRRADGTVVVFQVTGVWLYPKDHFPTAAVYGAAPGPELRLITCGGTFDFARHSYLSNVVVYATATT